MIFNSGRGRCLFWLCNRSQPKGSWDCLETQCKHNTSNHIYIHFPLYHPICITTIVIVYSWVFCFQGKILGRNSAGLIMNEGNLILQQVTKDSAGSRMIAHRWWWWICFGVEMRTTFHPFGQSFGILSRCTRAGALPTSSLVQINIWIQILNISLLHNVCWS